MAEPYPHVFAPVRLGPVEVANRVYFSAHSTPQGRTVSEDYARYMEERAAGGVGLLVHSTSVTAVPGWVAPHHASSIPAFARVAEGVHRHGARIFGQMSYAWAWPLPWEAGAPERPWLAPSVHGGFSTHAVAREMTAADIRETVALYAAGTANFRQAGYDGVEIHVTHGSPVENFLSPYWNRRTDEYGGSVENRVRYVREILAAVRDAAGPELAVGIRFNCDEMLPGGYGQDEAREILAAICAGGQLDFVDLDIAVEPQQFTLGIPPYQLPKFLYEGYVRSVREAAGDLPVLAALARVTAVAEAERALAEGSCDMVGVTRGLVAEPRLLAHARAGEEHLSRRCTACNHCIQQVIRGSFGCAINPATARERRWGAAATVPAPEPKRVVVIGGGPAGVEAARVAAVRGHAVTLLEREVRLGGQYRLWSALPGREGLYDAIAWYGPELARLGVDVRTGTGEIGRAHV